ncbi:MAG: hypothetical protein KF762_12410 [Acidobacteria bacterium]|nr:hypothetical protein [Acidobacteriota bacterium]
MTSRNEFPLKFGRGADVQSFPDRPNDALPFLGGIFLSSGGLQVSGDAFPGFGRGNFLAVTHNIFQNRQERPVLWRRKSIKPLRL